MKVQNFIKENNMTRTVQGNHGVTATLFTLETWFVSGTKL